MTPLSADATRLWAIISAGAITHAAVVEQTGWSPARLSACVDELVAGGWLWSETEPYRPVACSYREYALRRRARTVLAQAVSRGEVRPSTRCARCHVPAAETKLYGLQRDAQQPLLVEAWLCATCYQVAQRSPSRAPLRRRRGRPGVAEAWVQVSMKLPAPVYDAYCRRAITAGVSVHALLRRTLSTHACSTNKTGHISAGPAGE